MKTFIQIAVGAEFQELASLVSEQNAEYCAARGIQYVLATTQHLPVPSAIDKEFCVCEWMDSAQPEDLLIVSDADVLIQTTEDIFTALSVGLDWGMVYERGGPRPGVMWFRGTEAAKKCAVLLKAVAVSLDKHKVPLVESAAVNTIRQSAQHGAAFAQFDRSWHSNDAGAKIRGWHQLGERAESMRNAVETTTA